MEIKVCYEEEEEGDAWMSIQRCYWLSVSHVPHLCYFLLFFVFELLDKLN